MVNPPFRFEPPNRVQLLAVMVLAITMTVIVVWPRPRQIARCPFHGVTMEKRDVPIRYGLFRYPPQERDYMHVRESSFPFCDDAAMGGCVVRPQSPTSVTVRVCPACNAARTAWRSARGLEPGPDSAPPGRPNRL